MNSRIIEHYHHIYEEGNVPLWKQREAVYAAIRCEDAGLLGKVLCGLPYDKDEYTAPAAFALREMASEKILESLIDSGHALPYPGPLPFNGTPEEVIRMVMRYEGKDRKESIRLLSVSIFHFLERLTKGYSSFRTPTNIDPEDIYKPCFLSYLDSWLSEFIRILEKESDDEIRTSLTWILVRPELTGALKTLINTRFFDKTNLGWYMSRALSGDNEGGFSILLDMAGEEDLQEIHVYPRTSMKLLGQLFERGVLIPGTDKAYEAFDYYISSRFKKVDEAEEPVLRAIMHPSYGDRRDEQGHTILMDAIFNRNFEPYLYPVLVTSPEELNARDNKGRTALYYLAKTEYPECLSILTGMGAIPYCVDEKGNNVLHVLLGFRMNMNTIDNIEYCMSFLPKDLITMRNADGKTPMELLSDKLYASREC